jgi:hypothetical protein
VSSDGAVEQPRHAAWQLFPRQEAKVGSGFGRRLAGNVEKARDANTVVGDRHSGVADFIDKPGAKHGAVELSTALEHQLAQTPQQRTNTVKTRGDGVMLGKAIPITPKLQHSSPKFMNDILNKATVLALNRNWQAVNVRTPQEAFCMMATNVTTGLEIEGENHIRPVTWDEWITLPIRPQDNAVQSVRGPIRVPTAIVAVNAVIPYAVGADIACRLKMTVLDMPVRDLEQKQDRLTCAIEAETRFGVGATFRDRRAHEVMDADWPVISARLDEVPMAY